MRLAVCFAPDPSPTANLAAGADKAAAYRACLRVLAATAASYGDLRCPVALLSPKPGPPVPETAPVPLPFAHRPPERLHSAFDGAFLLLDAIEWFARTAAPGETIAFLDPDCLVTRPLAGLDAVLARHGASALRLWYPADRPVNGASRAGLARWAADRLGVALPAPPPWIGGEFLALSRDGAARLAASVARVWEANLAAIAAGAPRLVTEEQVLTLAFALVDLPWHDGGRQFAARIWTTGRFQNANRQTLEAPVWHLPAQKATGFSRLAARLDAGAPLPHRDDVAARIAFLARGFGLAGPSARRLAFIAREAATALADATRGRPPAFARSE